MKKIEDILLNDDDENESEFIHDPIFYLKKADDERKKYYGDGLPVGDILFNSGLQTIDMANAVAPDIDNIYSAASPTGWTRIPIGEIVNRISPMLTIVNYNRNQITDDLYFIYSSNAELFSTNEWMVPAPALNDTNSITIKNVYEIRLRSPTEGISFACFEGTIG